MPNETRKVGAGRTALRLTHLFAGLYMAIFSVAAAAESPGKYRKPFPDDVFPIGVWLQQPDHAQRYKDLGINLYVGLWKGPTAVQLASLKRAAMPVICEQNETGLTDANRDIIVGWLQQDEPDNAQPLIGKIGAASIGWGSPIAPTEMQERYRETALTGSEPTGIHRSWQGRRLGCLERARQPHPSPRGLSGICEGRRHRFLRHLSRCRKRSGPGRETGGRRAGREALGAMGRPGQAGMECDRGQPG